MAQIKALWNLITEALANVLKINSCVTQVIHDKVACYSNLVVLIEF